MVPVPSQDKPEGFIRIIDMQCKNLCLIMVLGPNQNFFLKVVGNHSCLKSYLTPFIQKVCERKSGNQNLICEFLAPAVYDLTLCPPTVYSFLMWYCMSSETSSKKSPKLRRPLRCKMMVFLNEGSLFFTNTSFLLYR